jgi:hypothetical protein
MRVYYLTQEKFALDAIENKWLKASLFDDLNDPFELLAFNISNIEQRKVWNKFKNYFSTKAGLICFSSQWQNPVMWSHYGDKHKGICLGFDVDDEILKKVKYISKRRSFKIGETLDNHKIDSALLSEAVKYKFREWSYEREYRGIVPLEEREANGHYFVNFSDDLVLKEVIIGAHCNLKPTDFKEKLLPYSNKILVKKALLAFQTFKVVRNISIKVYKHA